MTRMFLIAALAAASPDPGPEAAALLARASAEMGVAALEREGFVQWTFAGTYDESVERAGFEPEPPATVRDTFAVDLRNGGAGWDSEGRRGDQTVRWRRFLYPAPDLFVRVDVPSRWASASRSDAYRAEQPRAARPVPQALLREMGARVQAVRRMPGEERDGVRLERLAYTTEAGDDLDVLLDAKGRVSRVELVRGVPFVGERRLAWVYGDWTRDRGVLVPRRLTILVGEEPLRVLALEKVGWDREASIFRLPEGMEPPAEKPGPRALGPAPLAPSAREIAAGVWMAPDVRPGIHAFFVRGTDGVTVFDAPSGFLYPQIEIPPPDLARGRRPSEPGEALVDLVQRTLPGQPIRRLVISHAHADHAGGVRAFAAAGAEILVAEGAAEPVRRYLEERFPSYPDRFEKARATLRPKVTEVGERLVLGRGAQRFEILPAPGNPHSSAMLVLWLPGPGLILQGDLFYADPLDQFPSAARLPTMKWFAGWLERTGLAPAAIWGTHNEGPGTPEHLAKLRATDR
jgi:glyoxylase-like metal-dependent hydrolase (beta-lactamase superfamily II)